ncbi:MAG: hypothetical protein ACYS1A_14415 [Planctomycetota bacterium]|jgi:prepilin-type processing-associated H-X9-DG protein
MSETENNKHGQKQKILKLTIVSIGVIGLIIISSLLLLHYLLEKAHTHLPEQYCLINISALGKAVSIYSYEENNGEYPAKDKWCDLLKQHVLDIREEYFTCKEAGEGRCHYAINPNCEPSSPNDVVLLFETKDGWNQYGGPELLTFDNHRGKGCNVLFNDGRVEFVIPERIDELNWGDRQKK